MSDIYSPKVFAMCAGLWVGSAAYMAGDDEVVCERRVLVPLLGLTSRKE
jgi:hypothetical protein